VSEAYPKSGIKAAFRNDQRQASQNQSKESVVPNARSDPLEGIPAALNEVAENMMIGKVKGRFCFSGNAKERAAE
jgi:hypothetical protein